MTQTTPAARIEAALARIEASANARQQEAAEAAARLASLKREVGGAIAALDRLLGAEENA